MYDHQNKQRQLREEIKVNNFENCFYGLNDIYFWEKFQARVEHLTAEVVHEYLQRKPHRAVKGDFAMFPTTELTRALKA